MKNSLKAVSASILAAAILAPTAQAEISANVALTSDYVWRGISQNQEDPAIQGGFDYAHDSGFYIGTWGSNVNFGGASTELDVYAGWSTELESGVGLDFGIIEYTYHGSDVASDLNFTEYYAGISYAGFGALYSVGDELDDQWEISYGYDFENGLSLAAAYGDYTLGDDYQYFSVGGSMEVGGVGLDLTFYSTDTELVDDIPDADDRLVFTISKEF
ncbi:TorF family putative porin [Arenicella xantha]|uniref:Uncharacterized protein (TIGR02001 family) n=1 Tax=Arenicella xantha TaxID=644221 RepID=A0A395JKW2_9GAMM|nr:TorF family putative porin [Arenicella xantha]RBP51436.1 uncharacterized protein (TIGR02001 family) [Arenicella xantha]